MEIQKFEYLKLFRWNKNIFHSKGYHLVKNKNLFKNSGHKLQSVGYSQSNRHAELAAKASKWIITDNTSNNSDLNDNKAAWAIFQYCNAPFPEVGLSPAKILFDRQLRDCLPINPKHYTFHKQWLLSVEEPEQQFPLQNQELTTDHNMIILYHHYMCKPKS